MPSNDVILLEDMLERSRALTAGLPVPHQDVMFVAKHYLRNFRPSHDDLLHGIVDGTLDGGLDAIYIFANGFCVRDDQDLRGLGRNVHFDLFFLQVKNTAGFAEDSVDKLIVHIPELLDFSRDEQKLAKRFNGRVLEITRRFLSAFRCMDMPSLSIYFAFASLKAEAHHPNLEEKAIKLKSAATSCFASCHPEISFLNAGAVADMARELPITCRELTLAENPVSTDTSGGYVSVVRLTDYLEFITDETGKLDPTLFEANVRDYEGTTDVNRSIQDTLGRDDDAVDFWWLNNGVTIVANRVQPASKLLKLDTPQVVNGLQTSHEIYKRSQAYSLNPHQSLLVKVIEAAQDTVRDRIIQATNSQTTLGLSSLRATDKVQRQIEEFLRARGLYYERRKNYYFNQGIGIDSLVSIDMMGQAVLSTLVQVPHIARGHITTIYENDIYGKVFNGETPLETYFTSVMILRRCKAFLQSANLAHDQGEDFVFHLAMMAAVAATRVMHPKPRDLHEGIVIPNDRVLGTLFSIVQDEFATVSRRTGEVLFERIAKSPAISEHLQKRAEHFLQTSRRS